MRILPNCECPQKYMKNSPDAECLECINPNCKYCNDGEDKCETYFGNRIGLKCLCPDGKILDSPE